MSRVAVSILWIEPTWFLLTSITNVALSNLDMDVLHCKGTDDTYAFFYLVPCFNKYGCEKASSVLSAIGWRQRNRNHRRPAQLAEDSHNTQRTEPSECCLNSNEEEVINQMVYYNSQLVSARFLDIITFFRSLSYLSLSLLKDEESPFSIELIVDAIHFSISHVAQQNYFLSQNSVEDSVTKLVNCEWATGDKLPSCDRQFQPSLFSNALHKYPHFLLISAKLRLSPPPLPSASHNTCSISLHNMLMVKWVCG